MAMDEEKCQMLRMTAQMDGEAAIVANIGKKVQVSEMELICLANFAEIGLMCVFSEIDGKTGEEAQASLDAHIDRVREKFSRKGRGDGLTRLSQTATAMLRGKFFKYVS